MFILGLKHSGKTTLGKRIAGHFAMPWFDSDDVLTRWYLHKRKKKAAEYPCEPGSQVFFPREIMQRHGMADFLKFESLALADFLEPLSKPVVLSLGGGTASNPHLRGLFLEYPALKIYLRVPEDVLFERILNSGLPPYLDAPTVEESRSLWRGIYTQRHEQAESAADITVGLGKKDIEHSLLAAVRAIEEYTHGGK